MTNINNKHLARISNDETLYYGTDHLGTTVLLTDETGTAVWTADASPFGDETSTTGSLDIAVKYTGKDLDIDTGLYYFNARWYDSDTGRFINVDPIQDGTNWYVYCNNNPLNKEDPTGLMDKQTDGYVVFDDMKDSLANAYEHAGYDTWQDAADTMGIRNWYGDNGEWLGVEGASLEGKVLEPKGGILNNNSDLKIISNELDSFSTEIKSNNKSEDLFNIGYSAFFAFAPKSVGVIASLLGGAPGMESNAETERKNVKKGLINMNESFIQETQKSEFMTNPNIRNKIINKYVGTYRTEKDNMRFILDE